MPYFPPARGGPLYDLLANRPAAADAGDKAEFVATDASGSTLSQVQVVGESLAWVDRDAGRQRRVAVRVTETPGAGVYTATWDIPAGALIRCISTFQVAPWSADTALLSTTDGRFITALGLADQPGAGVGVVSDSTVTAITSVLGAGNTVPLGAAIADGAITLTLGTDGDGAADATQNTAFALAAVLAPLAGVLVAVPMQAGTETFATPEGPLTPAVLDWFGLPNGGDLHQMTTDIYSGRGIVNYGAGDITDGSPFGQAGEAGVHYPDGGTLLLTVTTTGAGGATGQLLLEITYDRPPLATIAAVKA